MRRFLLQCLAFARRDAAIERSYGASLLLGAASGFAGLLAYHFVGRLIGPEPPAPLPDGGYFPFVCSGVVVQLVVAASLGGLGSGLAREAAEGTLEPVLAAGASPAALVVGSSLLPTALALLQGALYAALAAVALGLDLSRANPAAAALSLAATLVACAPIGLLGAAAWLVVRRTGLVTTAAAFGFGIVGGVYFPVDLLPGPLARAAAWVPLAAGLEAVRAALFDGAGPAATAPALGRAAAFAAVAFPVSLVALRASLARARRHGTLALV